MKQIKIGFFAVVLFLASCQKGSAPKENIPEAVEPSAEIAQRCASQDVLQQKLAADPTLRQRREAIEAHTQKVLANRSAFRLLDGGIIEIPVIVHVVYRTNTEN